jgi:hypothetical protein
VLLDALRGALEVGVHAPPDDLGVGVDHERGRVDEVGEENRGQLALHRRQY